MEMPDRPTRDPYQEIPVKDFSYINTKQRLPKKTDKHSGLLISGLIILVLLGSLAYLYGRSTKPKVVATKTTITHKTVTKVATGSTVPSVTLTNYSSASFNLSVSYPTTWAVSSNGNTSISFTSPEMHLTAASGKSVDGEVVLSVFNQGAVPAAFGSNSQAVLASQIVVYSSPTPTQAAQTYISFVQYPATTLMGGLDAIYVSGNDGYMQAQDIPVTDINQIDPLIITSFEECQDTTCSNLANLTISSSMWSQKSFSTPILDIIKSFSFN